MVVLVVGPDLEIWFQKFFFIGEGDSVAGWLEGLVEEVIVEVVGSCLVRLELEEEGSVS